LEIEVWELGYRKWDENEGKYKRFDYEIWGVVKGIKRRIGEKYEFIGQGKKWVN
jgi:hypothetical protein